MGPIGQPPTPGPRPQAYISSCHLHSPVCVSEWQCMDHMDESPYRTHRVYRVSEVLAVVLSVICLWSPCMSAPTEKPLWVNPCGDNIGPSGPPHEPGMKSSDQELLSNIIISAQIALDYANQFSDAYVRKTFKENLKAHHAKWLSSRYPWLPNKESIPKELWQETADVHFNQLGGLNLSLLKSYGYLQRLAVGLEQVNHDKQRENDEFSEDFEKVMYKLKQVLCEVNNALSERNPNVDIKDIERSIMDDETRSPTGISHRHLRDWVIFRDLMNCLEYLIQMCNYFKVERRLTGEGADRD